MSHCRGATRMYLSPCPTASEVAIGKAAHWLCHCVFLLRASHDGPGLFLSTTSQGEYAFELRYRNRDRTTLAMTITNLDGGFGIGPMASFANIIKHLRPWSWGIFVAKLL